MHISESFSPLVSLNPPSRILNQKVTVKGATIWPYCSTRCVFYFIPLSDAGYIFSGSWMSQKVPYSIDHIEAMDSGLGRMLVLRSPEHDFSDFSSWASLRCFESYRIDNGIIHTNRCILQGSAHYRAIFHFWFKKITLIQLLWPGIEWFVQQILPIKLFW